MPKKPRKKEGQIPNTYEDNLREILDELGISFFDDASLILHNDNVNDQIHIVIALFEVCKLSNEKSMEVMLEAHNNGNSLILTGELKRVLQMKSGLDRRGIITTVEVSEE